MRKLFFLAVAAGTLAISSARGDDGPAELFNQLDANGDGQLTANEIAADKKSLFERLVRVADENGDGQLTAAEFAAGLSGRESEPAAAAAAEPPQEKKKDGQKPAKPKKKSKKPAQPAAARRPEAGQLFKRLDANADGKIVLDEVPESRRAMFEKLIARADKDGDGALSLAEFSRGMPAQAASLKRPQEGRDPAELFGRMDRNSDGKVTADEIPEDRRPRVEQLIKRGDKDGDGALSREEFMALAKNRPQKPAKPASTEPQKNKKPAKKAATKQAKGGAAPGLFGALDADRDGSLSSAEIDAAPAALRKLDKNGDGSLSMQEVAASGSKKMKKKKP